MFWELSFRSFGLGVLGMFWQLLLTKSIGSKNEGPFGVRWVLWVLLFIFCSF